MKKRSLIILLSVAVLIICAMAAVMTGCKTKGDEYADLVAIRINNHMAEWVDSSYNFDYKGVGELNVTVPYTNYLEINDLIVSPEAYAIIYEDETCSEKLKDSDYKIYVDGSKSLYVKVTNNNKSNVYKVNITVKQTNLPEGVDLSAKSYDNRGGHIYIPEGATEVKIDGEVYAVVNRLHELDSNRADEYTNFIASGNFGYSSISTVREFTRNTFNGVFDGNGYSMFIDPMQANDADNDYNRAFFSRIGKSGVVKNIVLNYYGNAQSVETNVISNNTAFICYENYGVIDNIVNIVDVCDLHTELNGEGEEKYVHRLAIFANINCGVISNCLNKGNIRGLENNSKVRQFSVFANEMYSDGNIRPGAGAKLINCVNMGDIDCNSAAKGNKCESGAYLIAALADKNVTVEGVYNVGAINNDKGNKNFAHAISVDGKASVRKIDCSRIKDYTK
ncbi:MAG: hypothetical protein K2M44_03715 [Clostridia bacterium]|nr:hypothetical protein [Clostridia bacterium]